MDWRLKLKSTFQSSGKQPDEQCLSSVLCTSAFLSDCIPHSKLSPTRLHPCLACFNTYRQARLAGALARSSLDFFEKSPSSIFLFSHFIFLDRKAILGDLL